MRRAGFTDEEVDEMIDELTEKEILWGIFQQSIETNRHLRTVSIAAGVWLVLLTLGVVIGIVSVAVSR